MTKIELVAKLACLKLSVSSDLTPDMSEAQRCYNAGIESSIRFINEHLPYTLEGILESYTGGMFRLSLKQEELPRGAVPLGRNVSVEHLEGDSWVPLKRVQKVQIEVTPKEPPKVVITSLDHVSL